MGCRNSSIGAPHRARHAAPTLAAIAGVALLLAGCSTGARYLAPTVPTDYRQRHPISLKEGARTVRLFIGSNRGGLTPAQRADVTSFAMAWKRESSGGIVIDVPTGTSNARAARDSLREIHSIFTVAGVPTSGVYVRPFTPDQPGKLAAIRLRYSKIVAEAGPCGLWPHDLGLSYNSDSGANREYWNLGCASQRNLAAMIDNPADLVQPRGETPAYTPRRTQALEKYRKGESPATNYPNASQGKISDVGK
jgi:pilus assembly protein CpaD